MKKTFDCLEMKRELQEELWKEGGETIEGLKRILLDQRGNPLYLEFIKRRDTEKREAGH